MEPSLHPERQQLIRDFTSASGRITSPGRFENEPLWTPYFYYLALEGRGEDNSDLVTAGAACWTIPILDIDRTIFPELAANAASVEVFISALGFIYGTQLDAEGQPT